MFNSAAFIPNSDLRIGLGTSHICSLGRRISKDQIYNLLQTAAENGICYIDTANYYGSGDAEYMLGDTIKRCNFNFHLTTKAGYNICELPSWCSPVNQIGKHFKQFLLPKQRFEPDFIVQSLQNSLQRLQVAFVDVFFLHDPSPNILNDAKLVAALQDAQRAGLFLKMGVSIKRKFLDSFLKPHFFTSIIQTQVNAWNETPISRSDCIIFGNEIFGSVMFKKCKPFIEKIAKREGLTPRQLLLAYSMANPHVKMFFLGTRSSTHLKELVSVCNYKISEEGALALSKLKGNQYYDS